MTPTTHRQLTQLFNLADEALDSDFVDLKFVEFFNSLREDRGLARLLFDIREFVREENKI